MSSSCWPSEYKSNQRFVRTASWRLKYSAGPGKSADRDRSCFFPEPDLALPTQNAGPKTRGKTATCGMSGFAHQHQPVSSPEEGLRKDLLMLEAQRDALELEADAIASELKSPGPNGEAPVGVRGPLVDGDGFPLPGFDLFNVREKRHR